MKKLLLSLALTLFVSLGLFAVPFTLHNSSLKSIPLRIPGVMNPNLSPVSDSGVDLAVGQEIFFYHKKKKYLLLTVTESLRDQRLVVDELIRDRKRELGL